MFRFSDDSCFVTMSLQRLPIELWDMICQNLLQDPRENDILNRLREVLSHSHHPSLQYLFHDYLVKHAPMGMVDKVRVGFMKVSPSKITLLCGERLDTAV